MGGAGRAPSERRIAFLTPRRGQRRDAFERYWLSEHGPLVAGTSHYGLYRANYVQDHVLGPGPVGDEFPFAGMASVRMPSGERRDFAATRAFRERILPDEEKFLERGDCVAIRALEHRIVPARGPVKVVVIGAFTQPLESGESSDEVAELLCERGARHALSGWSVNVVASDPTGLDGTPSRIGGRVDWVDERWFAHDEQVDAHYRSSPLARSRLVRAIVVVPLPRARVVRVGGRCDALP